MVDQIFWLIKLPVASTRCSAETSNIFSVSIMTPWPKVSLLQLIKSEIEKLVEKLLYMAQPESYGSCPGPVGKTTASSYCHYRHSEIPPYGLRRNSHSWWLHHWVQHRSHCGPSRYPLGAWEAQNHHRHAAGDAEQRKKRKTSEVPFSKRSYYVDASGRSCLGSEYDVFLYSCQTNRRGYYSR